MRSSKKSFGVLICGGLTAIVLAGCAQTPTGPTVAVWPPPGKPFDVFRTDDAVCRQYATTNVNSDAANNSAAAHVAIGTVVGAAAGALIGDSSQAAGVGAGVGLLAGSASAAQTSQQGNWSGQQRYNIAYEQCMYSRGNLIPGAPQQPYYPPPPPPHG
ncbi:MAG: glycine zipper family protein [Gammaproteobacteria bacterium]